MKGCPSGAIQQVGDCARLEIKRYRRSRRHRSSLLLITELRAMDYIQTRSVKGTGHWGELMVEQRKGNQQRWQRKRERNVLGPVISLKARRDKAEIRVLKEVNHTKY